MQTPLQNLRQIAQNVGIQIQRTTDSLEFLQPQNVIDKTNLVIQMQDETLKTEIDYLQASLKTLTKVQNQLKQEQRNSVINSGNQTIQSISVASLAGQIIQKVNEDIKQIQQNAKNHLDVTNTLKTNEILLGDSYGSQILNSNIKSIQNSQTTPGAIQGYQDIDIYEGIKQMGQTKEKEIQDSMFNRDKKQNNQNNYITYSQKKPRKNKLDERDILALYYK